MDVREIIELVGDLSVTVLLVLAGYGGLKKLWVWGWLYLQEVKEKNEWKALALELLGAARESVSLAEASAKRERED